MSWRTTTLGSIAIATWLAAPHADAAPCKDKQARIVGKSVKVGQVAGKLKNLRKKDGKHVSFNTTHYANHKSELYVRWPLGMQAKWVRSFVIDVAAKPLPSHEQWWIEIRHFRKKKWTKMGKLTRGDGGGDKSFALTTVDANFYRHKGGNMKLRIRSARAGDLQIDRLLLWLKCE